MPCSGTQRAIAHAIANGVTPAMPADVVAAADAPAERGSDARMLVVGGPNHAFGIPPPTTRAGAVKQNGAAVADSGPACTSGWRRCAYRAAAWQRPRSTRAAALTH